MNKCSISVIRLTLGNFLLKLVFFILKLKSENKTILLTSHNQSDLNELCDKIYYLEDYKLNETEEN